MTARVICIGPNLPDQTRGSFHVHAVGCADIDRSYRSREFDTDKTNVIEVNTLEELVEYVYADQLREEEDATASDYANDFYVFPCVKGLHSSDS